MSCVADVYGAVCTRIYMFADEGTVGYVNFVGAISVYSTKLVEIYGNAAAHWLHVDTAFMYEAEIHCPESNAADCVIFSSQTHSDSLLAYCTIYGHNARNLIINCLV